MEITNTYVDFANPANDYTTSVTVYFHDGTFEDQIQWTAEELENNETFKRLNSTRGYWSYEGGKTDDIEVAIQHWDGDQMLKEVFQDLYNTIHSNPDLLSSVFKGFKDSIDQLNDLTIQKD